MGKRFYKRINDHMHKKPLAARCIAALDAIITAAFAISYPLFLMYMHTYGEGILLRQVIIPLLCFAGVSAFRHVVNAARPSEIYGIVPLKETEKRGRAFPSRHVFCAFMLAETYLYRADDPFVGVFYIGGFVLGVCRVLLGVHRIRDVACGCVVALLCGLMYYI